MRCNLSFGTKLKETPQSILEDQFKIGGRLIMTIPFGSSIEKMQGFVSVIGGTSNNEETLPILTICVQSANLKSTVSTIVFNSDSHYLDFIDRLSSDAYSNFKREDAVIN